MIVPFNVRDFLDRAEVAYPDRIGVVDEPDQPAGAWPPLTFADLARRARAQALGLDRLGIGRGERVAVVSHNSSRLLTSFFGVCGWGRILVPVNFRLAPAEVEYIVEHSGATVLLLDPEVEAALSGIAVEHRFVLGPESDEVLFPPPEQPGANRGPPTRTPRPPSTTPRAPRPGPRASSSPTATAGSTPRSSGGTSRCPTVTSTSTRCPCSMPTGGACPGPPRPWAVPRWRCARWTGPRSCAGWPRHDVSLLCAAPAVVNAVLDALPGWDGPIPGRDRTRIVVAGAPPPSRTIERIQTELGWEFNQIYGLTETSPLLTVNRHRAEWDDHPTSTTARKLMRAGPPAVGTTVRVDAGGEVLVRSNTVMEGYWNQPDETEAALSGGWFHTGDGGVIDDEGHLSILDRKKDVIISGGENVSSIEVEDAIFSLDGVVEVAVIGVPDDRWGEMVIALVVAAEDSRLSEDQVIAHCRTVLAGYKCPKRVELRPTLPRTATGKLQKFRLRAPFWEGKDRQVN